MCFFSPIRNDPRKIHKQNVATRPILGQSRKFVYVYVFFFSLSFSEKKHGGNGPSKKAHSEVYEPMQHGLAKSPHALRIFKVSFSLLFRYFEFSGFRALWDLLPLTNPDSNRAHGDI